VAADDPWAERTHAGMADVVARRLLMREVGAGTRAFVDAALRAASLHTGEMLEVASVEALKRMAEAGVGVAIVPCITVSREAAEGRVHVVELDVPSNRLAYRLMWHKDKAPVPGLALFREVMGL
jgi:DNA-binding transcriptional LysR family regulator